MKLDFIWSTQKGYASIKPLFEYMLEKDWDTSIYHIHKLSIRNLNTIRKLSDTVVIAYNRL